MKVPGAENVKSSRPAERAMRCESGRESRSAGGAAESNIVATDRSPLVCAVVYSVR